MNLIPTNAYICEHLGEVADLPMPGQWVSIVLLEDEFLWISSDDQRGSFHLYRVPPAWRGFSAFEKRVRGRLVGLDADDPTYVCITACPMGWLLAVKAMQAARWRLNDAPPPGGLRGLGGQ